MKRRGEILFSWQPSKSAASKKAVRGPVEERGAEGYRIARSEDRRSERRKGRRRGAHTAGRRKQENERD